ncbi:MAG TPA: HD domain-containing phosphohydrolase [Candidatus Elarobacter sp.]
MLAVVVDDNVVNLRVYVQVLARVADLEARAFGSSAEALAYCLKHSPDLIVLDYRMPPPDGLTFIRDFRAARPDSEAPIVMITGEQDRDIRHRALEAGASDFLTKPADPVEFLARARNLLALRKSSLALRDRAATLTHEIERATREIVAREEETINRLMRAAEFRDNETGNHILRMGRYAELLGKALGLAAADQRILLLATPMHDIGKVSTPDSILLKPGPLTKEEWVIMRRHTNAGHAILSGSTSRILKAAADIALWHHERWDGLGYPDGLAGDKIPLSARIATVGDVFDALVSERPYKKPWPFDAAIAEIAKGAGTHFDPQVAQTFVARSSEVASIMQQFDDGASAA